jgi:uncharacterized coiled-coil protein SlyX
VKAQLESRLAELKSELQAGEKLMNELNAKQANLHQAMLRISGAIQVLEELLAKEQGGGNAEPPPTPPK